MYLYGIEPFRQPVFCDKGFEPLYLLRRWPANRIVQHLVQPKLYYFGGSTESRTPTFGMQNRRAPVITMDPNSYILVELWGVEPQIQQCHCYVIPFHYSPKLVWTAGFEPAFSGFQNRRISHAFPRPVKISCGLMRIPQNRMFDSVNQAQHHLCRSLVPLPL